MKKLSLKNLKLGADDMLQRNQLKSVLGGYGLGEGASEGCEDYQGIIECICHFPPYQNFGIIPCADCAWNCSS
ncbi:hypothetical protein Q4Q35_07955 [Flavivirga aquimarina]|uniref:Bacteriocin n=1 Tax=Flavivirga aquimarina TaxID=2027862 RepID=A0ABT8W9C0_9FLAO|nr:hypothetical protein [Flavivirga aquimarina]MDO5969738.1 hypothetical protein [Flavivirga aquimarina]